MRRILSLFLVLLLVAFNAYAAAPAKQLPGDLTLAEAQTVLNTALAFSVKQGIPMNIAVVDFRGPFRMARRSRAKNFMALKLPTGAL